MGSNPNCPYKNMFGGEQSFRFETYNSAGINLPRLQENHLCKRRVAGEQSKLPRGEL